MLEDQRATLEIVFDMVKHEVPLTHHIICGLHEIVSKHQDAATGIDPFGKRTEIPLRKGQYKLMPNNPRRPDGETHYYCPPEQTQNEMDRVLTMHQEHEKANVDSITEAAWLHHRFVQIHPFQNGNGRIARLLLAYVIAKGNGFPPIVDHGNRNVYINSLEKADQGDLQPFVDFLAVESSSSAAGANSIGENVLKGVNRYIHGNGGVTINDKYHGPGSVEAVRFSFHVPPIKGVTKISASEDKEPDITH